MRFCLYERSGGDHGAWWLIVSSRFHYLIEPAINNAEEARSKNGWPYFVVDRQGKEGYRTFQEGVRAQKGVMAL